MRAAAALEKGSSAAPVRALIVVLELILFILAPHCGRLPAAAPSILGFGLASPKAFSARESALLINLRSTASNMNTPAPHLHSSFAISGS